MKLGVKLFTAAIALFGFTSLWAATFTYEAVNDFTDIDAGAVPYYRHNGVNALAINAAVEAYRDEFAQATLVFGESTGIYDVTITALGEIDGDGEFRFLVDGEVVGSAVNTPVTEDYGEQLHKFENISIPAGALLGVESIAVSNDKVPEGDGYAYARGRWTTLTIAEVGTTIVATEPPVNPEPAVTPEPIATPEPVVVTEPTTPPDTVVAPDPIEPVDLSITLATPENSVNLGVEVIYTIEVENLSQAVATAPIAVVSLPVGLSYTSSDTCAQIDTGALSCALAEIAPGDSTTFTLAALAATVGEKQVTVEVSGDQEDSITDNNTNSVATLVRSVEPPVVDDTVDLQLEISANKQQLEIGELLTYTLTVTNLHDTNTATSPSISIDLPDSLQLEGSDLCSVSGQIVFCDLEELTPGQSITVQFTATAVNVNSYSQVIASASSAQSEDFRLNNNADLITDIRTKTLNNILPVTDQTADQAANLSAETNTNSDVKTTSSGGGALSGMMLLLLLTIPLMSILASSRRKI